MFTHQISLAPARKPYRAGLLDILGTLGSILIDLLQADLLASEQAF